MKDPGTNPVEGGRERPGDIAFAFLLFTSVASAFQVPLVGVGLPNLVVPLAGLVMIFESRREIGPLLRRHAFLLSAVGALLAWTALSAVASPDRGTAIRLAVKAALFAAGFAGLLVRFAEPERAGRSLRTLLGFLVVLALLGVAESFFPHSLLYGLFREERSLSILPRISSVLPWPNPYGVLMAAGVALAEGMAAAGLLKRRTALAASLLFLSQVAQSGSRNAWAVALLVLGVLAFRALVNRSSLRTAGLAAFFAAGLFLLPVAAYQLRIEESSPVARALLPAEFVGSSSLSDPMLSLSLRGKIWRLAFQCIPFQPVLGLGPGVFTRHATPSILSQPGLNAHSLPLNLAVDLGLPGLALGVLVLVALRPARWLRYPAGGALAALLAGQVVDCFLYEPATLVVMMACAAAVASPREDG